jgi:oxygen-independent coproporphyrinogen-3 oxidase
MDMLHSNFQFTPGGEYSIEVDPRTVNRQRLAHLAQLGFNRISFGVQDFDADVQQAVHRVQPSEQVLALVDAARQEGFESINVDLIYGLPRQTQASFAQTLQLVKEIRPDRIALYAYAHLPARFKPQRRIHTEELPSATTKIDILAQSFEDLTHAGYVYVGMDHFALATDSLAVAKNQGLLHRNFQGYSTQPEADLMGIGVSAIGRIGMTYSQNAKTLEQYYDLIRQGQLPVVRGLALNRDDCMRRAIIMALMCQGELDFSSIESAWLIHFKSYFASEIVQLNSLQDQGLIRVTSAAVEVTETGWFFVRAIAMVFDRYLQADAQRQQFSRII